MRLPSPRRRTVKIIGAGQREEFRGLRYTAEADIRATDTVKLGEFTVGHIEFGPSLASDTYGTPIKPVATLSDRDLLMDVAADNLERAEKAEAELAQSRERETMAETTRDIWHRVAIVNNDLTVTAREERDHARFIAGRLAIEKRQLDMVKGALEEALRFANEEKGRRGDRLNLIVSSRRRWVAEAYKLGYEPSETVNNRQALVDLFDDYEVNDGF